MHKKQTKYKTLLFDCDGVVLDSNKIKTNSFYNVTKNYNICAANELVDFHRANGGISRYVKLEYFINHILPKYAQYEKEEIILENLLNAYSEDVKESLLKCNFASDLNQLKQHFLDLKWSIVSGGDQDELRYIFKKRKLNYFFDGGIYGSPDDKETILKREFKNKNFLLPAIFIGDSKYDYIAAKNCGIDFIFLNKWTEFKNWEIFTKEKNISVITNLSELEQIL